MHGHTRGVSRDRPDFVRSGPERCWIDGDLIRLSQFPVGGIRPGVRGKPVPWLMDLAVLEEAMREVYGRSFDLGDRAPLLQLAADALAEGDRTRGAEIADAVAFPPPEFKSRFRDAGFRYLAWGRAHRRGNPRIDIDAWLAATSVERKYDPDQPRVPRGHPDGGQWTDGSFARGNASRDLDRAVTDDELERAGEVIAEVEVLVSRATRDSGGLLHLTAGPTDPLDPFKPFEPHPGYKLPPLTEEEVSRNLPTARPNVLPPATKEKPQTRADLVWNLIRWLRPAVPFLIRTGGLGAVLAVFVAYEFPEVATYFDEPKTLAEMRPSVRVENYTSYEAFEEKNPAGAGYQWHHIRERNFGDSDDWKVDATENIVRVPVILHRRISDFYSSKPKGLGGLTVREWVRMRDPEFQWRFGLYVLRKVGAML